MNFLFRVTLYDTEGTDIGIADSESVEIKIFNEYAKSEADVWLHYKWPDEEGFDKVERKDDEAYYFQITKEQAASAPLDKTLVVAITHGITDERFTEDGGINYVTEKGKLMIVKKVV